MIYYVFNTDWVKQIWVISIIYHLDINYAIIQTYIDNLYTLNTRSKINL